VCERAFYALTSGPVNDSPASGEYEFLDWDYFEGDRRGAPAGSCQPALALTQLLSGASGGPRKMVNLTVSIMSIVRMHGSLVSCPF
jgi:hypothetical protein